MEKKTIRRRKDQKIIEKDCYSLDYTFCRWIIPRLKWYIKYQQSYPTRCGSLENWNNILQEMVDGFQEYVDRYLCPLTKEDEGDKLHKSLDLFKEYFCNLWY